MGRGDEVVPAVATTLGVDSRSDIPIESRLVEALRGRRVLLVLDNCEHVIDAAAALVERIVAATTTVSILATSRERLAVSGEHVCAVEPLDDVLAGELFVERVPRRSSRLHAERGRGSRRLVHLPATRWSAAGDRAGGGAVAGALGPRDRRRPQPTLPSADRGTPTAERHRSLVETVRWSFDLLDDHEREVCEQLAVFSGGPPSTPSPV